MRGVPVDIVARVSQWQSRPVAAWRLPFAWLGTKRDAERSLQLLPDSSDLPGENWQQDRQQTWYTGRFRLDAEWIDRARRIKSLTATRWFTNSATHHRFTLSVYPLASHEDAQMAVTEGPTFRSTVFEAVEDEHVADDVAIPGSPATRASEQQFKLMTGKVVEARFLRGCTKSVLFSVVGRGCEHHPNAPVGAFVERDGLDGPSDQ